MMKGYWQQQDATGDTIKGGWVYTGDLAYQDEDDYIYLAGRARDFIKRGGEMISPEEVEQVLMSHPQVADGGHYRGAGPGVGRRGAGAGGAEL